MSDKYIENCGRTVLIGKHSKVIAELKKRGIRCLILENNDDIDFSVRNHADIEAFLIDSDSVLLDRRQMNAAEEIIKSGKKVIFASDDICGEYPGDVSLNAAKIGDTIICNKKYIAREIRDNFEKFINVKQGYTKCSICIVSDNAFITDDSGIYEKCKNVFDVLLVQKGDILLEDKNYGFIGGASGKIDDTVYFFGNLETHVNSEEIKRFITAHNASYECLFEGPIVDIGGLIAI